MTAPRIDLGNLARQVMIERGFEPDFPADAIRQVAALSGPAADGAVRDLRALAWASIDNDDSRDLDQLTVAEELPGGAVRVLVAIAEVDSTVGKGSPVDRHARRNTTSVYTAARIFPMLPEKLSTDLTSLAAHEERLAVIIEFVVNDGGSIGSSDVYRARVRNQAKLAYGGVGAWLAGEGPMPPAMAAAQGVDVQIRLQDRVAQTLAQRRHEHGALDLEVLEALADFLVRRRTADRLRFPDLSLSVVKLLGRGEYVVQLPGGPAAGHFGLAVSDYVHSTAPNRRFPDLVTQRLVKAALNGGRSPYDDDELAALATHCTEKEDAANRVERQVRKSAAALLLRTRIGERFDAIVTGASEKGTWVRVLQPPVEGKLIHGHDGLDVGDRVGVRLVSVNVERGFIDFDRSG